MVQSALYEHRFWLQILGDHGRFIHNALSPKETKDINKVIPFIQAFDRLLEQARTAKSENDALSIANQASPLTLEFREFKLSLLQRSLLGKIAFGLTPTFINHMVNELEEYLRILNELVAARPVPTFSALHEMAGYMRTHLQDFPAFRKLHSEVDLEMKLFVAFLGELEAMELSAEILDRISPLMPDHMMREECYYLTKLAHLGLVPNPECKADKPRVET